MQDPTHTLNKQDENESLINSKYNQSLSQNESIISKELSQTNGENMIEVKEQESIIPLISEKSRSCAILNLESLFYSLGRQHWKYIKFLVFSFLYFL